MFNIVDAVRFFIASETWKSERSYKPFSARLAFLRRFDSFRWYQTMWVCTEWLGSGLQIRTMQVQVLSPTPMPK